jgi:hypothetical protein
VQTIFELVSQRITALIGSPVSPGRWRLKRGGVHADCSAHAVIVRILHPAHDSRIVEVRAATDMERVEGAINEVVAATLLDFDPE